MGPKCPECETMITFREEDVHEPIYVPRSYTCENQDCFYTFWLDPEEIQEIQQEIRKALNL